jgi:hypothetical protein
LRARRRGAAAPHCMLCRPCPCRCARLPCPRRAPLAGPTVPVHRLRGQRSDPAPGPNLRLHRRPRCGAAVQRHRHHPGLCGGAGRGAERHRGRPARLPALLRLRVRGGGVRVRRGWAERQPVRAGADVRAAGGGHHPACVQLRAPVRRLRVAAGAWGRAGGCGRVPAGVSVCREGASVSGGCKRVPVCTSV